MEKYTTARFIYNRYKKKINIFFSTIPLLYTGICFTIIASIWVACCFYIKTTTLSKWEQKINSLSFSLQEKNKEQKENSTIYNHYRTSYQNYLDKCTTSLFFLNNEIKNLENLLTYPEELINKNKLLKRLQHISSSENKLKFIEGPLTRWKTFQEINVTLLHPVEVDINDISKVIEKIEGNTNNKPHCFITLFSIKRNYTPIGSETYKLNLNFIQRNYE